MSTALAIAGVTAVLRDLLNDGLINHNVSGLLGSTVTVSALPPDRVVPVNGTESTQLNLFLHQVTFNTGWRNHALPSRDGSGMQRLSNPPLALDLHYLLSAYSAEELGSEILLGYAMQLLHEVPVLDRRAITTALTPSPSVDTTLPPALRALAECGLADQVEQIKLVPDPLSSEEMSKLWTAVQSHYRPSAAYVATVVLIESSKPTRSTLPVLSRGPVDPVTKRDRGVVVQADLLPPFPTIQTAAATNGQPAATVGAIVELTGHHLDGTNRAVLLSNSRFDIEQALPVAGGGEGLASFTVPAVPAGLYQLAMRVIRPGESDPRISNAVALVIGPEITSAMPVAVVRDGSGVATLVLSVQPQIQPGQTVSLLLGTREIPVAPITVATGTVTVAVADAPTGEFLLRIRVDGIDSPIIDRSAVPPAFYNYRVTIT
ncbi:DUF4255 domain-containing protein [Nitrospira defluvii]|uniref:Pvc16 N-terminal domain-containing protein n=1 Tax=Nitrospira defluvii TaxID=330214 RepID=A0ABM8S6N1_9BACT|nr:DUF4255 domain-containing protein [Nitrospira defluvii]CAE6792193.1 conserved hypothetical protein [Nitrospira defluvii]